jgi:hypothetical protein
LASAAAACRSAWVWGLKLNQRSPAGVNHPMPNGIVWV